MGKNIINNNTSWINEPHTTLHTSTLKSETLLLHTHIHAFGVKFQPSYIS